ncbi:MAG TPA: hypothetical protein VGN26_12480 [Armatimonadota bacterium]
MVNMVIPMTTEGTIAQANVSQLVLPARGRRFLRVVSYGPSPMFVALGQAAEIGKGYYLLTQGADQVWATAVPASAVYIICAVAGQAFAVEESL